MNLIVTCCLFLVQSQFYLHAFKLLLRDQSRYCACDFPQLWTGVGKTHLSVSLAEAAIQAGFGAYLMTAHDLGRAYREGRLDRRMRVYWRRRS